MNKIKLTKCNLWSIFHNFIMQKFGNRKNTNEHNNKQKQQTNCLDKIKHSQSM